MQQARLIHYITAGATSATDMSSMHAELQPRAFQQGFIIAAS